MFRRTGARTRSRELLSGVWIAAALATFGCGGARAGEAAGGAEPPPATQTPRSAEPAREPSPAAERTSRDRRRYFKRTPDPTDAEWLVLVLDERSITLLSPDFARVIPVADSATVGGRTTFSFGSAPAVRCTLERPEAASLVALECPGEPRTTMVELDASAVDEIERIERELRARTPPADACERAERCCKAAWPLLVPGETCDVELQLGRERFADTCVKAMAGFEKLFARQGKDLPAECR